MFIRGKNLKTARCPACDHGHSCLGLLFCFTTHRQPRKYLEYAAEAGAIRQLSRVAHPNAYLYGHAETLADTITGVDWTLHKGGEKMCPVIARGFYVLHLVLDEHRPSTVFYFTSTMATTFFDFNRFFFKPKIL